MKKLSKICDASDWFDPEFNGVVKKELCEEPRFHRKQWEFAMIYLALEKLGMLKNDKLGLSLGGGNERVLYSIANHVNKLIVTDLYDTDTTWDCAKTGDPNEFIRSSKPFPIDDDKIEAMRMDMRYLDFEDNKFDFCYSSCAIEHIGGFEDFVQHLNEVYRTLKEGGVYVFTTEFQFGSATIKDPNNYIFSPSFINHLIDNCKLTPVTNPDVSLTDHVANMPFPSNVVNLMSDRGSHISNGIMENFPHLVLLRGKYPFTSILLILRKETAKKEKQKIAFNGFDSSKKFTDNGVKSYASLLEKSDFSLNPFSMLPNGVSYYYLDHSEFFKNDKRSSEDNSLFHTDYFWLGNSKRIFNIRIEVNASNTFEENVIQFRIHRYATLNSEKVHSVFEKNINVNKSELINERIILKADEEHNYAFLAKMTSGGCSIKDIKITSVPLENSEEAESVDSNMELIEEIK